MCGDILELDSGVLAEPDVPVVPAEVVILVCVVIAQYLACLYVVILEPVEPVTGILLVLNGEHLDASPWDGTVQFEQAAHPICDMTS